MADKLNVVVVEPGEPAVRASIAGNLEGLQQFVGGMIEVTYPFDDSVGLLLNEEGKLLGLPLNRALTDEDGNVYDIVAGRFAVVGLSEEGFQSLTPEQEARYLEMYKTPERFVRQGNRYVAVPVEARMSAHEFREALAKALVDAFSQDGLDVIVEPVSVGKVQASYEGLSIRQKDDCVGVSIDTAPYYEAYKQTGDMDKALADCYETTTNALDKRPAISIDRISDYDWIKGNLAVEVVSKERNLDLLSNIPYTPMEDLAVIYRVQFANGGETVGTATITDDMLRSWGVSKEQLHRDAMASSVRSYPVQFTPMQNILTSVAGHEVSAPEMPLVVCNTQGRSSGGAGAIAYPDFVDKASQIMGGDFFVLPSSRHEVILLPDSGREDIRQLEQMVKDINRSGIVRDEDILSDSVYHYASKAHRFELAAAHKARMAQQVPVAVAGRKGR